MLKDLLSCHFDDCISCSFTDARCFNTFNLSVQDELREAVLLVFANKQDLPNAMNAAEITDKLGLHALRQRRWYVHLDCIQSRSV